MPSATLADSDILAVRRHCISNNLVFCGFSILSVRERRAFWASPSSAVLNIALFADAAVGLLVGAYGLAEMKPLPVSETTLIVGVACVISLMVNDFVKVALMARYRPATS